MTDSEISGNDREKAVNRETSELQEFEEELQKADPELMDELSPSERQRMVMAMQSVAISHSMHSGPLPAPEALREYNEIIPDGANRIMLLTEKQSNHRMELEKAIILSNSKESSRGQLFGFIIAILGIVCSTVLIFTGRELAGSIIFGTTLLGMVTVFVIGKKSQSDNSSESED